MFEYISSGAGYFGAGRPNVAESKANSTILDPVFEECVSKFSRNGLKTGFMYNAYVEPKFAEFWDKLGLKNYFDIYADSGGLQIVTSNAQNINRDDIYKEQTFANFACCFDEIPVRRIGEVDSKIARTDNSYRLFDHDMVESCAVKTGENINKQAEVFDFLGKDTKILAILQGNCYDTYMEFFEHMYKTLSPRALNHIGGICIGFSSLGSGDLEIMEAIRVYAKLSHTLPEQFLDKLHLLGVGSIKKFLPFLILRDTGYLSKFKNLSLDSSSFAMAYTMGKVMKDGKFIKMGYYRSQETEEAFRHIYDEWSSLQVHPYDVYADLIYDDEGKWAQSILFANAKKKNMVDVAFAWSFAYTMQNILDYCNVLIENVNGVVDIFKGPQNRRYNNLKRVTNDKEFEEWYNLERDFLDTARIKSSVNNLDKFF